MPAIAFAAAPIGWLEAVQENGTVTGWALDPDNPAQPLTVNFYIDGGPGTGKLLGTTVANAPRRDVNGATGFAGDHGFSWTAPAISDDRVHRLSAYALEPSGSGGSNLTGSGVLLNVTENTILGTLNMAPGALEGAASIVDSFKGSPIVITTANAFAGAIFSLTWNGKQFINNYDHGRELQSASFFDGYLECLNPTEAGSGDDGQKLTSTSRLLSLSAVGNVLRTRTQMAFWIKPGGESGHSCGSAARAVNTTVLSSDILSKTVTIGFQGMPNVIEHQITFTVTEPHASALFQAVVGFMPASFSKFWSYNPLTEKLEPLSDRSGYQRFPVVLSTADGSYAMGVYSPDEPQTPEMRYGRYKFSGGLGDATNTWICRFDETNIAAGDYNYRCYSIIGTLNDVRESLSKLYSYFGAGARVPPGTPSSRQ
ncbi:MAG TPA: hypothetical protein VGM72_02795 [Micropepsaceae bacterium]